MPLDFAKFCPPTVARASSFLVQCFLYPPDASAAVDAQARQADDTATRRGTYSLPLDIPRGARIDLQDLGFRYDDKQPWLYRHMNLALPAGKALAIMGPVL